LVEHAWLELVQEEVRKFLAGTFLSAAPIVPVSSVNLTGFPALRQALETMIISLPPRLDRGIFWMPVDRAFIVKGFGTVATGSALSGQIGLGEEVEILPGSRIARVRSLQRHGKNVEHAQTGDRVAVNLQGVAIEEVARGQVLTAPHYFRATSRLNCRVRMLKSVPGPLRARARVRVHLGTAEVMARILPLASREISPGQAAYVQLHLEKPVAARRLEAFVLRRYSPPKTIGGGVVLQAQAQPVRRRDGDLLVKLRALEYEDPAELLVMQLLQPDRYVVALEQLVAETGQKKEEVLALLAARQAQQEIFPVGKRGFMHRQQLEGLWRQFESVLVAYHQKHPLLQGLRKAEAGAMLPPLADSNLLNVFVEHYKSMGKLKEQDAHLALTDHEIRLSAAQERLYRQMLAELLSAGFAPASPAELAQKLGATAAQLEELLGVGLFWGELVRLESEIYMTSQKIHEAQKRLIDYLRQHYDITVSQFKELIGNASRKFAVPLLQYFDAQSVTERQGEKRILSETAARSD